MAIPIIAGLVGFAYADNIPYWIEDTGGSYNLWEKVSIPAGGSVLLNISKGGGSPNGDAVFEFFDDFEGTSLDTSKWDVSGLYSLDNGKIKLNPGGSGDSYGEIRTKKLFGKNVTIYSKIYSHSSYVRYKFGESDGVSRRVYVYDDGGSDWWGFRIDDTRYADGYYVGKLEYSQLTIGDDFVELKDNNVEYNLNHELSAVSLPVYFSSWCDSYITLDYIYIRKYAPQEPTVNVNSSGIDWVVINISNPNNYALNDFQVKIPNSDLNYLITQKNEPLTIKDLTNGDEGNQPVKSPIPPLAIIIALITIPIIALRKLN